MSAISHAKVFDYVVERLKKGELPTKSDIEANGSHRTIVKNFIDAVLPEIPKELNGWPKKVHQLYPFVTTESA